MQPSNQNPHFSLLLLLFLLSIVSASVCVCLSTLCVNVVNKDVRPILCVTIATMLHVHANARLTRMHSSRMCTVHCSGHLILPRMPPPPLPHMPPHATHTPLVMHAPCHDTPYHTCPPRHAHPLPRTPPLPRLP